MIMSTILTLPAVLRASRQEQEQNDGVSLVTSGDCRHGGVKRMSDDEGAARAKRGRID